MGQFPAPAGPGPTWAGAWLMAVKRRPHARGTGRGGSGGWSTGRTLGVEPPQLLETGLRHPGAGAGLHPPIAPPGCRTLSDDARPSLHPVSCLCASLSSEPRGEAGSAPGSWRGWGAEGECPKGAGRCRGAL